MFTQGAPIDDPVTRLVHDLALSPHPEGGWFKRIYTATEQVSSPYGLRPLTTSIWYLLGGEHRTGRRHRNRSDILHFLIEGGPLEYQLCDPKGHVSTVELSPNGLRYLLVPGNTWKSTQLSTQARHALVAEVVTPGFDLADHEFDDTPQP